ncbi:hypothetical protein FBU31_003582 [Coemansia sp. 'formosensis']|nr:hypothetical protein FBU31_003582 [Coemansia sp. 'formosensis']
MKLQGSQLLLPQQDNIITKLIGRLQSDTGATRLTGTATVSDVDDMDDYDGIDGVNNLGIDDDAMDDYDDMDDVNYLGNNDNLSSSNILDDSDIANGSATWSISVDRVDEFISNCGNNIRNSFDTLLAGQQNRVVRETGQLLTSVLAGISRVSAIRDHRNQMSTEHLLPVLPRQLVQLSGREFAEKCKPFLERFGNIRGKEFVASVELQFLRLVADYKDGESVWDIINGHSDSTTFDMAWEHLQARYPVLCDFVGGLATVLPNSARVEADFSDLNRTLTSNRLALTDISLEGCLQASHYKDLFKLGGIEL